MTQSVFIPTVFPSANDVLRIHPQVYSRMKRDFGMLARVAIRRARLRKMVWADITFVWHERPAQKNKQRDPDNIRFGAKFCLDALVAEGILEDDSFQFILGLSDRFIPASQTPGVVIELDGECA